MNQNESSAEAHSLVRELGLRIALLGVSYVRTFA